MPGPKGCKPHVRGADTRDRPPLIPIACHNTSAAPGACDGHWARSKSKGTGQANTTASSASRYGVRMSLQEELDAARGQEALECSSVGRINAADKASQHGRSIRSRAEHVI